MNIIGKKNICNVTQVVSEGKQAWVKVYWSLPSSLSQKFLTWTMKLIGNCIITNQYHDFDKCKTIALKM